MIDLGRDLCGDFKNASRREWLVTNGLGGYAAGTVSGVLTRHYHGLLIAALDPPLGRTALLSKLDEDAAYGGRTYPLYANRWADDSVDPRGFVYLEHFRLEGTIPVWSFSIADALLEKRVWMQRGANTTYVRYDLLRGTLPLSLSLKALVTYRDHHAGIQVDEPMSVTEVERGLKVTAFEGATPFYLLSERSSVTPRHEWYRNYKLSVETYRGLDDLDDTFYAGRFEVVLQPGESVTFTASTEAAPDLNGAAAYKERQKYEAGLLEPHAAKPAWIKQLVLAADAFIVRRALPDDVLPDDAETAGRSVIAGYPWFGDWGRDTMIALPGLTLATGRFEDAATILRTFARFVAKGMLPNRFPDEGETPEYNTVDATLWYVEAVRAYLAATNDLTLVRDLFPVLADILAWHQRGTRYGICRDPADGLLYAGEPGVQLTWMDAKVGDWVVTPRTGKAVEINALWYHALCCTADFAERLGEPADEYTHLAEHAHNSFARFWNEQAGYLYDVIDSPAVDTSGKDSSLRPNQLLAVSLTHSPLSAEQQRAVVDACARHLLTSCGLRSLAQDAPAYAGHYGGGPHQRDGAYHQGTVWSWLIGPFVSAYGRVYGPERARAFLDPFEHHLSEHGLGSVSEVFDGDAPFTPRGCFAQAWGVGEVLRAWTELSEKREPGEVAEAQR